MPSKGWQVLTMDLGPYLVGRALSASSQASLLCRLGNVGSLGVGRSHLEALAPSLSWKP